MKTLIIFLLPIIIYSQTSFETDMDAAYANAKKGIYWALANIPETKSNLDKDLILDDKIISHVKISKEIGGVKVEAKGIHNTYELCLTVYRTYESLKKEGILSKNIIE
ncbi:MAG: hypothetical protein V1720_16905 [bacterium]